jgi:3-dehydroquinate dehydratase-1
MICVAISSENTASAIEKSKKAITLGAKFIEIRIDHFKDPFSVNAADLVRRINSKVILTVRKSAEGGQYSFEEHRRLELIHACINARPFAIDLEFSIERSKLLSLIQEAHEGHVKVILSFHDFQKTPSVDEMKNLINEMENFAPDIIKIIGMANSIHDNLKMLALPQFVREKNLDIVAFAMGAKGIISRILSPIFGTLFTFASLDKPTASGQISIPEMKARLSTFSSLRGD